MRIQLHPTVLQFKQTDPVDGSDPICLLFQATTPADLLPKAKASYDDVINSISTTQFFTKLLRFMNIGDEMKNLVKEFNIKDAVWSAAKVWDEASEDALKKKSMA